MKPITEILGHDTNIQELQQRIQQDSLQGSFLFSGPEGIGKHLTAKALAFNLLSRDSSDTELLKVGNHPDYIAVAPGENGSIKIDQARELIRRMSLKPQRADRCVAVINNCDCLTPEASNALLKSIEEPVEKATFFLITSAPGAILPTIRSRCQQFRFGPLNPELLQKLLQEQTDWPPEKISQVIPLAEGSLNQAMHFGEWSAALNCHFPELYQKLLLSPYHELEPLITQLPQEADGIRCVLAGLRAVCRDMVIGLQGNNDMNLLFAESQDLLDHPQFSKTPEAWLESLDHIYQAEQSLRQRTQATLIWETLAFSFQKVLNT